MKELKKAMEDTEHPEHANVVENYNQNMEKYNKVIEDVTKRIEVLFKHVVSLENVKLIALISSVLNFFISLVIFILLDFSTNQFQFVQEYHERPPLYEEKEEDEVVAPPRKKCKCVIQ